MPPITTLLIYLGKRDPLKLAQFLTELSSVRHMMKHAVDEDHVKHPCFEGQFLRRCCRHVKAIRYLQGQFWIRFHAIEAAEPLTRPLYEVRSRRQASTRLYPQRDYRTLRARLLKKRPPCFQ